MGSECRLRALLAVSAAANHDMGRPPLDELLRACRTISRPPCYAAVTRLERTHQRGRR